MHTGMLKLSHKVLCISGVLLSLIGDTKLQVLEVVAGLQH